MENVLNADYGDMRKRIEELEDQVDALASIIDDICKKIDKMEEKPKSSAKQIIQRNRKRLHIERT